MSLSSFCIRRPIFATVLSVIIVLTGFLALRYLAISQYPNITPPSIFVSATYEGADARTLARTVAAPIEDQLSGVPGLLYYTTSLRSNGDVRIQCIFDNGRDPNDALLEINNRIRSAERRLPDVVRNNGVNVRKRNEDSLLFITLWSPDKSYQPTDLADYANLNMVDDLRRVSGVGDITVMGNAQSAMRIWLDLDRMAHLGVTVQDVRDALEQQNTQRAAGRIGVAPTPKEQQLFYTVRTPGQLLTPEQFGNVIVKTDSTQEVIRIRDLATTEVGKRSYEFRVDLNGEPAVNIGVYMEAGANAMQVAEDVKAKIDRLATHFPKDKIAHIISDDTTIFVDASLQEVYRTLLESSILVFLIVFLFLQNWRATVIPFIAVPVSLIGTLGGLYIFGFSLNILTLFALTLAIGIVVDDAIVVLENVERLMRRKGLSAFDAAIESMKEVSGALVAIVLVLCSVFIPVAFIGGIAGELYRQFAITISIAIVISGFVALTLTPALCAIFLKPHREQKNGFFVRFNTFLANFTQVYVRVVQKALVKPWLTIGIFGVVVVAAWQLLEKTPTAFLPKEDQGVVRVAIQLPTAAAFPRTEKVAEEILDYLHTIPEIDNTTTMMGWDTLGGDQRANAASIVADLVHWDDREKTSQEIQQEIQKYVLKASEYNGVAVLPPPIAGLGSSNGFQGYIVSRGNDNPQMLQQVMEDFLARLGSYPSLTSLRTFQEANSPQLEVFLDENKCITLGVEPDDVFSTINAVTASQYINDFTRNGKTYRVVIQAKDEQRSKPEDLGRAYVRSKTTGEMVPISSLIEIKRTSGAESLSRFNGSLAKQFSGAPTQGYSTGQAIALVEKVAQETLPDGYQVEWVGQAFHEKRIGSSSATVFGFGLLMMFLILAALYERWSLPIAIVLSIPYALLGALLAITIRGTTNDIYFQIGLMVLVGLCAKNAILIVEIALQKVVAGMHPIKAALEAAGQRFRPILMTSLAFILGVVPLMLATGPGAGARHSMGTGVFGGMLFATFIATIFVPVFFTWFLQKKKASSS